MSKKKAVNLEEKRKEEEEKTRKKLEEVFTPGVAVLCEMENVTDPKEYPFKYANVNKIAYPAPNSKNREIYIEVTMKDTKAKAKFLVKQVARICQDDSIDVPNMAEVSPINTKDLLQNIQNRYNKNNIFTNVGETLIITNPYQIFPGLYDESKMEEIIKFSEQNSNEYYVKSPPHCFDVTMHCIFDLLNKRMNQALVISGESGAGKTECAKLCMKCITYYFGKRMLKLRGIQKDENEVSLEDKILACNPILEAFGNAKTVRNDNSSRFGKYIKLFVKIGDKDTTKIIGAFMETYLLEKSRVVTLAPGERNYHIFYQVLVGLNELIKLNFDYEKLFADLASKKLNLTEPTKNYIKSELTKEKLKYLFNMDSLTPIKYESFHYLKNDVYTVPTIDDVFNFYECLEGMVNAGFPTNEMDAVIKIIMAILFNGNIEFVENNDECTIAPKSVPIQQKVAEMLGMDLNLFSIAFLRYKRIINKKIIETPLNKSACTAFRDTFAKEIYNRLFGFLVKRMNLTLFDESVRSQIDDEDVKHIGLLDIFGFECFKENSFEQFCINYANEKLQNLYVEDIFKEIERMFEREGLSEWYCNIEYKDNILILDAMGKPPYGIFYQLDDHCSVAPYNLNDMGVLGKIFKDLKNNPTVKSSLKHKDKFFIIHTAKDVEYTMIGFCEKNLDEFKLLMKESVESMKDEIVRSMVGEGTGEERHKKEKFLGGKFRSDMDNLARALGECVRHYIRCLKPNEVKKKNYFVPWFSLLQIKYMGVLDTIRVRQEGYPVIKTYLEFYMKYEDCIDFPGKLFFKDVKADNPSLRDWCKLIQKRLGPDFDENFILFGSTLVLMRQKTSDVFEEERKKLIVIKERKVSFFNNKVRGVLGERSFMLFYGAISTLQQNFKLFDFINKMNKLREIAAMLQNRGKQEAKSNHNKDFVSKLKKLKNLFISSSARRGFNKLYIKYLRAKYLIDCYVKSYKHKKYLKYKALLRSIISKKMLEFIKKDITEQVIIIQKKVRAYLTKVRLGETYKNIVKRRGVLKEELKCKKIQKHFRKHFYMDKILKKQIAVDKFIGLIKYHRFHTWHVQALKSCAVIRRAYLRIYYKRKMIEDRLKEFTEEEDERYEDCAFTNSLNLFPDRQIDLSEFDKKGPQGAQGGPGSLGGSLGSPGSKGGEAKNRLEKMKKLQKYYDKKLSSVDPDKINLVPHLNHSPYDEPKLMFFAHILDLDAVINIDDIYPFVSWSQTYDDIVTHNLKQNTPIQLIEIGEYHTSLVNCLGKTFTWGWDGNGQCAFNISKDKKYLYDNFKPQKGINGNCISGSIEDSNCEGNVDKNIDFEAELENIKNEKEIFEDEDDLYEDVEGFSKNDFTLYYYLDSPIIIDNFNVRKISCGQDNTMVLTKEDKLYVFGANNYFQLGVLKSRNIFSPMSLDNIIKAQQENPAVDLKSKIIEMKFSGKNAILINENGNLIVLSCFCAGITGPDALYRTPIELPVPNIKFSEVECGKDFCLLKSQYGALYTFGTNQFGQLGHGDTEPRNYPTPVRFFLDKKLKVTQITCGYKHAGCRASNKVYIWGCNVCGQLGTGNLDPIYSPKLVELDSSKVQPGILQVSCGLRSTVFLAETRQLFWCGTNGDISKQTKPVEFNYHQKIPELFNYDNHQIVKINHTWSTTMSILYATVTEAGPLAHKLNNPNKMNAILNKLTNCWTSKDLYPPTGEGIDNYISEKHIIMDLKSKKKKRNVEDY